MPSVSSSVFTQRDECPTLSTGKMKPLSKQTDRPRPARPRPGRGAGARLPQVGSQALPSHLAGFPSSPLTPPQGEPGSPSAATASPWVSPWNCAASRLGFCILDNGAQSPLSRSCSLSHPCSPHALATRILSPGHLLSRTVGNIQEARSKLNFNQQLTRSVPAGPNSTLDTSAGGIRWIGPRWLLIAAAAPSGGQRCCPGCWLPVARNHVLTSKALL